MERHSIVFVTDQRQKFLAQHLAGKMETVTIGQAAQAEFCREVVAGAQFIILPTPVKKISRYGELFETLKGSWQEGQLVFGGKFPEELRRWLADKKICYYDLMEDERVAQENARITAEAVVSEVISRSLYSVEGQKIIITGYGRCARAAAQKLAALGAKITVLARSVPARKAAKADGFYACDFAYGPQEAYGTRTFINTVPATVVTEKIFREMHEDTLVLDIASAPGGCDREAAAFCGIEVVPALGLPGIYTPKSSAKVLADAILEKTQSAIGRKEEKTWIFQILPSDMA